MRILHIYKDYDPVIGGIENHIRVLARAQAARGHIVTVLVCDPGGLKRREQLDGVDVIRAHRLFTTLSMPVSLSQPIIAARQKPDVVHIHSPYPLGETSAWLFQRDVPLLITYHCDISRQKTALRFYAPLLRRVLNAADRIIATSPPYVETSPWLQSVRNKCRIVPLGVDEKVFKPAAQAYTGPPTLLFVGKLRYYKGLDTLLRALRDLPELRLNIVGDGPMREVWQSLASQLMLQRRVEFLGEVSDVDLPELYQQAHVFVLPCTNRAEAFGTVLLEAMASGLPCITSDVGTGTSWVVQHGVSGYVVAPGDVNSLSTAIDKLLADPSRRSAMGRAARKRVESQFTQEGMIEGMMRQYNELVTNARKQARAVEDEY